MHRNHDAGLRVERTEYTVRVRDLERVVDLTFQVRAVDQDAACASVACLLRLVRAPDKPHYQLSGAIGFDLLRKYWITASERGLA